jgi:hypothetical protein
MEAFFIFILKTIVRIVVWGLCIAFPLFLLDEFWWTITGRNLFRRDDDDDDD